MRLLDDARHWAVSPSGVKAWSRLVPGLGRRLRRPPLADLTQVRRLGVLRYDGMGDLLLTTGLFRELRRQLPKARIALICQTPWASWMRTCPWVDEVVDVAMTSPVGFPEPKRLLQLVHFIKRVWPLELEVLVQPGTAYWYVPSRALAWFSGAPVRLCWEDPDAGVDTGAGFHTRTLSLTNGSHEADKCFRMLEAMGLTPEGRRLDTWWTPDDAGRGAQTARAARRGRSRLIALGLAASEPPRRWPRERYRDVVREVSGCEDVAFLALGGPDVAESCRWLSEQLPDAVTYPGDRLPLGTVWAAIAHCDLYLGNESGLMHMAAAARIPVVAVMVVPEGAPPGIRGDPSHTGPYDTPSRVVRPPATTPPDAEPDVALVPVEAVAAATIELLSETRARLMRS
jgi:heptosyltransferase-2